MLEKNAHHKRMQGAETKRRTEAQQSTKA